MYNVVVVKETIFSLQKRSISGSFIEVDFAKAFDMVDREFLFDLLATRGFGQRWISWVRNILHSSKAHIFINGSPFSYVCYQRGCDKASSSPFLFVISMDVLNSMFTYALTSRVLYGVSFGDFGSVCYLQYVDDLIIMTIGRGEDLRGIKLILYLFEAIFGLAINFHKTCLLLMNFNTLSNQGDLNILHCTSSSLPITYMGVPLAGRLLRRQDWENLIATVREKLGFWKASFLSLCG